MPKQHRSPMYACIVFFDGTQPKRWKYVRDLKSFAQFLNKEHSSWKYMNVYAKGTKEFLKRLYPNSSISKTLVLLLLLTTPSKFTFSHNTFISQVKQYSLKNTFMQNYLQANGIYNTATISTKNPDVNSKYTIL